MGEGASVDCAKTTSYLIVVDGSRRNLWEEEGRGHESKKATAMSLGVTTGADLSIQTGQTTIRGVRFG